MNSIQRELDRRIFYLSALNDLGKEIGPLQDVDSICNAALSVTTGTFGAIRGLVYLVVPDTGETRTLVSRGVKGEEAFPGCLALQDLKVLAEQEVCRVDDVEGDLRGEFEKAGVVVWMPLSVEGRLLGGMSLGPKMSGEPYTDEDQSLLGTISDSVSMAAHNALLYEDLQRANDRLERENRTLKIQVGDEQEVVSRNPRMQEILELAWKVAETSSTVFLQGESGTGKEVIARAIYRHSPRREGPFVPVHCGALPAGLLESELFGHEKGAFTGATARRQGRFELADGGTLFLDEIGEIEPEIQIKLLRVLQERQFERVGGSQTLKVNIRLIAATNRNLEEEVSAGRFREDLYFRLNVIPIVLPPLRERREDIPPLVEHFMERYSRELGRQGLRVSPDAMGLLMTYAWPGNIRELENLVERMVVVVDEETILPGHLPPEMREEGAPIGKAETSVLSGKLPTLAEVERRHLVAALIRCEWNQSRAARLLHIIRAQICARIKKYGIQGKWKLGAPKQN